MINYQVDYSFKSVHTKLLNSSTKFLQLALVKHKFVSDAPSRKLIEAGCYKFWTCNMRKSRWIAKVEYGL